MLLGCLVVGGLVGWWFKPFVLEENYLNGQKKYRLNVRCNLNGQIVTYGEQSWWWPNGQIARRGKSFGQELPEGGMTMYLQLEEPAEYWNASGVSTEDWRRNAYIFGTSLLRAEHDEVSTLPDDRFPETPHDP